MNKLLSKRILTSIYLICFGLLFVACQQSTPEVKARQNVKVPIVESPKKSTRFKQKHKL